MSWGTNPVLPPHPVIDRRVSRAQGYLWKKGQLRRNWSERWFTLKPSVLSYYMSEERKEKKGSIALDKHCCVEVQPAPRSAQGQETQEIPFGPQEGEPKNTQFHIHEHGRASPTAEESGDKVGYRAGNAIQCPPSAGAARPGWEEVHVLREDLLPHLRDECLRHPAAPGVDARSVSPLRPLPSFPVPPHRVPTDCPFPSPAIQTAIRLQAEGKKSLHKDLKQKRREQREQREQRKAAKEEETQRLKQLQEEKERKLQELELLKEAQRQAEILLQEEEQRRRQQHEEMQRTLEIQLREAEQVGASSWRVLQ